MTDFSFQNRAYDLLLNLKEDGIIGPKVKSVKDVRLLMDIIETANQINKEYYRPVESIDIKPGVELKIVEPSGTWYHRFWAYADTGHTIPPDKTTLKAYSNAYMYIWKKAERGNVFIKQTFKYEINDYVAYKPNQSIKGYISDKCMLIGVKRYSKYTNAYRVEWDNPPKDIYWFDEDDLIKMLEAQPMKTDKRKMIKYESYDPKQWLKQQIEKGYDEAVMRTLLQLNQTHGIDSKKEFGWVTKYKKKKFCRADGHKKSAIQRKYERIKRKDKRIYPFKIETRKMKEPLKRVKFTRTGEIASMPESKARQLVDRNGGYYIYASKSEWREYVKSNKPEPKLCLPTGKDKYGYEYSIGNRKTRRATPSKYGATTTKIRKRKPVRYQGINTTRVSMEDRLERSQLDRERYFRKTGKKSLDELKTIFSADERRNDKFTQIEKWSQSFIKIYKTVTTGISEIAKDVSVILPKKGINVVVKDIIKYQQKFDWAEEKINDFVRYLRLTTHGVFTGAKPIKPKKTKQIIEHEPIKFITRIDNTKLGQDENGKIIDKGGAITQVPIKFRKKKNGKPNNTTTE